MLCMITSDNIIFPLISTSISFGSLMAALSALYTHTQELYPALLRGHATGWLTGVGFTAAIIVPIILPLINLYLGIKWSIILISLSCFFSAFFVTLLNETKEIKTVD